MQTRANSLVLGNAGLTRVEIGSVHLGGGVYGPQTIAFTTSLGALYERTDGDAGTLKAYIQNKQYATRGHTAAGEPAAQLDFVLRTPRVWVDRNEFYVAYMPKDAFGSTSLRSGYSVSVSGADFST